jgi:hypothetical protein
VTNAPLPAERRRLRIARRDRDVFLDALSHGWSVKHAAQLTGRAFQRFYDLRAQDEEFAEAWRQALERGTQVLEDEARRRAVDGVEDFALDKFGVEHPKRVYSDHLLMFLLRARRPDVYRDNAQRLELTGRDGGPLELTAAGYEPPGLADVVRLAGDLGVLEQLGYARAATVDGEARELTEGGS